MHLVCLVHFVKWSYVSRDFSCPSGARESRKAPRRRPPLPRRWRITTTTCPIPSTTCPSTARCVLDGDESMGHLRRFHGPCATLPWAMCDGSVGHRRLAPRTVCDGSMGHVRRLHGPQAAGKLPCATTLSSLDAAVVTRRRRRVTSFAFPSGGGRQRERLPTVQKTPVARFDLHRSLSYSGYARRLAVSVPPRRESLTHLTDTCSITQTTTSHLAYAPPPQPPPPPLLPPPRCCRVGAVTAAPYTAPSRAVAAVASTCTATPPHHSRPRPCCRRPDRTITGR